ncbi:hypothetical protein O6H91_04G011600 [Diphasiastrum complanatum]|uniref:Uncharacterized protein n=1 Tax=Diphasiastrum complanatum TaxID=34168 RepID=A0ACC2DU29_DIPCM|nr:hypothetical protein O6H91_04G011600 [Diphasiastrum complanatum]
MASDSLRAHAALLLVQINIGAYHVITKLAISSGMNELVFCILRDVIALAILAPTAWLTERRMRSPLSTSHLLLYLAFLGLTGIYGNQLLFVLGSNLTSPAFAASVQPTIPVFTFFLAFVMGTEQLDWFRWDGIAKVAGLVITVAGATIMTLYTGPALLEHDLSVQKMMSRKQSIEPVGMLIFSSFQLESKHVACGNGLSHWELSLHGYLSCLSGFMTLTGIFTVKDSSDWILSNSAIFSVIFAGLVASAINYWLQTWSNKILGPSIVALYAPPQPLFSSIFSRAVLGSPFYLGSILGGALIIAGLYCVVWGQRVSERLKGHSILEVTSGADEEITSINPDHLLDRSHSQRPAYI